VKSKRLSLLRHVAFTNASAFSPTDAMPLTVRIKDTEAPLKEEGG
jgi:hypothetical protein